MTVLVLSNDNNVYRRGAELALDAIVLMFNELSRLTRLDIDV